MKVSSPHTLRPRLRPSTLAVVIVTALLAALAGGARAATGSAALAPAAVTGTTTGVTATSAVVEGAVNPEGQATTYWFEYGPTSAYGAQTAPRSTGSGTAVQSAAASLAALEPGTTFHYRLVAENATGKTTAGDQTFSTLGTAPPPPSAPAPQAVTGSATGVAGHAAVLTGTGLSATIPGVVYFQYGTTAAYTSQTAAAVLAAGPTRAFSIPAATLAAHTVYHYRIVAATAVGLALGADRTFQTPQVHRTAPAGVTLSATRTAGSATTTVYVSGRIRLPGGITASAGCAGLVSYQIERGHSTVSSRRTAVRSDCTFASSVRISTARLGRHTIRAWAHFLGNDALAYRSSPVVAVP